MRQKGKKFNELNTGAIKKEDAKQNQEKKKKKLNLKNIVMLSMFRIIN